MSQAKEALETSQLLCDQYFDTGLLSQETRLLFVSNGEEDTNFILNDPVLKRHGRTAGIRVPVGDPKFYLYRQWGFQKILSGNKQGLEKVGHNGDKFILISWLLN